MRRTLNETWQLLEGDGLEVPRAADGSPFIPPRMPSFDDDEPLSFMFFRDRWSDVEFDQLTLPRTYFARSLFERVGFRGSDLSESRMCWNDFLECDFTGADLHGCDLRASIFKGCVFRDADLSHADFRHASFQRCIFEGARLRGAIAHEASASDLVGLLESSQEKELRWVDHLGEEPPGG